MYGPVPPANVKVAVPSEVAKQLTFVELAATVIAAGAAFMVTVCEVIQPLASFTL